MITKLLKGFYDRKGNRWSLPVKDSEDIDPTGEGYDDSELRDLIAAKADKNHTHTGYAAADHNHDTEYAAIDHTHSGYAAADHTHSEYAPTNHTHSEYISKTADIDSEPAEGSEKLITSGAVYSACSGKAAVNHSHNVSDITDMDTALAGLSSELGGKLDAVPELEVHFDVSGGALVKVSDETEYDDVLSEAVAGVDKWVPIFIGIYDSNEDAYTKFMGTARIGGLTSNITHQLYEIDVDIYVGSYTIHLVKTVSTSIITVSTDRLTSFLS